VARDVLTHVPASLHVQQVTGAVARVRFGT
jgi:hypothetical protein